MALSVLRPDLRRDISVPQKSAEPTALALPVATRLAFYIGYYALNVCFTAEVFSVLLTLPVFIICCFNVSRIKSRYATAQDMIWLMLYMFFVIEPCQSLRSGYFAGEGPAAGLYFENWELITAEFIAFLFLFVATITSVLVSAYHPGKPRTVAYQLRDDHLPLLASIGIVCGVIFVVLMNGLSNVLADRYSRDVPDDLATISTAVLALQSIACMLAVVCMKAKPRNPLGSWLLSAFLCVLTLSLLCLTLNPFNSARFMLLMTYVPLGLILISGKIKAPVFYLAAMVGLLVVMPILNFTGRYGMSVGEALDQINISDYAFRIPYIEVFDLLVYEVRYVQSSGFYWGAKTLGVVLFFIPRAIWTGKATLIAKDIGAQLVDLKTAGTDNLSLFFAGEFYADLGLLGVAIGAVAVGVLLTIFGLKRRATINGLDLRSYLVTAAAPIIIRGPIAAVIPFLFMQMVFLAIIARLLCQRVRLDRQPDRA